MMSATRSTSSLTTFLLLVFLAVLGQGCGLLRAPQQVVTSVIPGGKSKGPDPLYLQLQVQRFADDFCGRTATAIDAYVLEVGTQSAQLEGLRWKLGAFFAAVGISSGAVPRANLLDLVSLTTLTRMTLEDRVGSSTNSPAAQSWLEITRSLETNVWKLASTVLQPPQLQELRAAIDAWHSRNPQPLTAFFARPPEFASMVKDTSEQGSQLNSVFSLVNLDPTAGLDPAVREVTLTRLFAERAMFTAQRMPFLLRLQADVLAHELTAQPAVQLALTNTTRLTESADRIGRAAESLSQTAAGLPERISLERKEILTALEHQEGKLRELAAALDSSLNSGEKMSTSLNATLTTFDAVMKRFGVGEPKTNAVPSTNSAPFNILDYARTAAQVGDMANDLNTLLTSVNQSVPRIEELSQQAGADARRLVDHAFRLALVLITILLAGTLLAALAYRIVVNKLAHSAPQPSSPNPP